jgi:Hemopexin
MRKNRLVLVLALGAIFLASVGIRRADSGPSVYVVAAVLWPGDKAQFFLSNGTYIRYDLRNERAEEGYPKPIDDRTWPGLGPFAKLIVTACNAPDGKAYFFLSNGQYVRYSIQQDKIDPGYPKPIDDTNWPGLGRYSGAMSSALTWKEGKIQFFLTNGQYIRYDVAKDRADPDYPKDVNEDTWPGLQSYKSLLAGAFNRGNGKAYIFLKDGRYIRYDVDADRADAGYPQAIDERTWPGMGSALGSR